MARRSIFYTEVWLGFVSGIAVSASTNMATGIDKQHVSVLHFAAILLLLASAYAFLLAAEGVRQARETVAATGTQKDFSRAFGVWWKTWLGTSLMAAGVACVVVEVVSS